MVVISATIMKNKTLLLTIFTITAFCNVSSAPNKKPTEEEKIYNINIKTKKYEEKPHIITGIIGGNKVSVKKFPYTAAVITRTFQEGTAIVLNKKWVLTSAWTIYLEDPTQLLVRAGSDSAIDKGQTSWADKLIMHPNYTFVYNNDIGLIKLKTSLKFNKYVKPIKFASKLPGDDETGVITGYGFSSISTKKETDEKNSVHDGWLRAASLKVITYKKCKTGYYQDVPDFTELSFCSEVTTSLGPCSFDYGAPFVYKNQLIGVFSRSPRCTDPQFPPIYSDITKFTKWIDDTIKANSDPKELEEFKRETELDEEEY